MRTTPPCAPARSSSRTRGRAAGALSNLKTFVFVTTLLLALVGGAGQASAAPGKGGPTPGVTTSFSGGGARLNAGVTWE